MIALPALAAAKIALYVTMRSEACRKYGSGRPARSFRRHGCGG